MRKSIYIGAHVSAQGGFIRALDRARELGLDAMQIFGTSPYSWAIAKHTDAACEEFRAARKGQGFGPVFFHAPYIINLASGDPVLRARSEQSLRGNLELAERLGIEGVIFHIGSSKGWSAGEGRRAVAESVVRIIESVPGSAALLLENSAGGGESVGGLLEDIGEILAGVKDSRVGFCFDTAHAFEAGVVSSYVPETVRDLVLRIKKSVGLARLMAIHANDSKTASGSHHDRHENIGKGLIGAEGIRALIQNPDLQRVPWILEVPGRDGSGPDRENVEALRSLTK